MALQPFVWGQGGQKLSPQEAARQREVAKALMGQNSGVAQNPWEGIAQVARAFTGTQLDARADAAETEGRAELAQLLAGVGPDTDMSALMSIYGNGWANPQEQAIAELLINQDMKQQATAEERAYAAQLLADERAYNQPARDAELERLLIGNEAAALELEQLRNPAPVLPEAPKTTTIYDPVTGRDQVVQWNPLTSQWDPVGGVEAPAQPLVQVNTGENDSALDKALSGKEGESWAAYKEAGAVSASNAQDFEILGELMTVAPQGPVTGRLADTFKGFSSAGDAAKSIIRRVAPTLRAPGSGSTSDIEYQGMLDSLPSLVNEPAANQMILSIMQAKAQINMERGEIVTKYQNGELPINEARSAMDELNRRSVMTPDMKRALLGVGGDGDLGPPAPQIGEEVEGYQFLGGDPSSPSSWKQVM